jgi:xanthine dehydrogenase iron-sulfur cluster and FAD-binding subunit A
MISGYLTRMVLAFAVVAVILFDLGAIAVNFFTLDSKADEVAVSIATSVTNNELPTNNPKAIFDAAEVLAKDAEAKLVRAEIDQEGVVTIRLRRAADTLVVGRVSAFEDWTESTADARAGSS